jgi:glycosyltransferase involved in cell wall biosynthesis
MISGFRHKRIAVILPTWSPSFINKNFGKLIKRFHDADAFVHVYVPPCCRLDSLMSSFPNINIHDYRIPCDAKGFRNIAKLWLRFIIFLFKSKPDYVIWTYAGYRENLILYLISLFRKIPYVIKTDSVLPKQKNTQSLKDRLRTFLFHNLPAVRCDLLLAETNEIQEKLLTLYPASKILLFPNGVPLREYANYRKKFSLENPPFVTPYLLYVGRFMYVKGIDILVDSFVAIKDEIPDWHLVLIGEIWEIEYLEKLKVVLKKNNLESRVHIKEPLFGEALFRWYYFASIFILPSRSEGLANCLTEAMYFGLPIIATNVNQTHSLVSAHTGILLESGDLTGLQEAILKLTSDAHLRTTLGKNARRNIENKYNDDILFDSLFRNILNT